MAQRLGVGSTNNPNRTGTSSRTPATPDISAQPIFVSGKVLLEGGGSLPEPVAIERVCNSVRRREGYTDGKGQFQFQLGLNTAFQDASESDGRVAPTTQVRTGSSQARRALDLSGCEFRAILAGYQSSTAIIRSTGDGGWQYDIGTIFLKRMGDAMGTTVSLTSMAAPQDAMHAYEKAQKVQQEKPAEAEKDLQKAVRIYPQFAAAWTMLGDMHRQSSQFDQARTEYMHAVAADPQYVNPVFSLAVISMQEKKWTDAAQFSDQVVKMNAMAFPLAYFFNAAANYNQQQFEAAELSAKRFKALDTQHEHPDVCLLLSHIYSRKQDYAGAARELRDYLAVSPDAPDADAIKASAKRFEDLSVSAKRN